MRSDQLSYASVKRGTDRSRGPSDRIRTCGLMVPNHARYQLRYTREFDALPKASAGSKIKMLDYFTTEKCFCQLKMKICEKLNFRLEKCDDM